MKKVEIRKSQAMRKGSVIAEARIGVMYAHGQDWFQILVTLIQIWVDVEKISTQRQGVKQSLSKSRTHLMAAHEKGSLYALGWTELIPELINSI